MTKIQKKRLTRDGILFFAGLVGVIYEAYSGLERTTLLLLYAGMMGLPAFIHSDERRNSKDKSGGDNNAQS